ncbi:MAG TPA: ABC transporter permease [Bacillales bacterium]|nr:ABC transporter permease [Bacillales bacterium]
MTDMDQMWRQRRSDYWNEAIRYLRLIGNSGFMFSIYVAFILGAYYYSIFLDWLSPSFPSALVFALIMTLLLVRSPIRTFLKEADLVFLLPLEKRMEGYFRKSTLYSFLLQSFTIVFVLFILSPFYFDRIDERAGMFVLTIIVILAVKYWNVMASWSEMYLRAGQTRWLSVLLRAVVTFVFTFLLFRHAGIYFLAVLGLVMVFLSWVYFRPMAQKRTLKWERLLEVEESRLTAFYRMANLFTEVPKLKNRVKPRLWLSSALAFPFRRRSVFTAFYYKTFVRANDFFGTYMRLLVVGILVLLFLPQGWGQLLVFLLVLYISGMQLYTIWGHRTGGNWEALYPIPDGVREQSFLNVVLVLMLVKTVFFGAALFVSGLDVWQSVLGIALGVMLSFLFTSVYLHRKITTV